MSKLRLRSSRAKSRGAGTESSRTPLDCAREGRALALASSALLLIAASPQTAVDAEREFASRAQTEGMWTAFRATAAPDAIMFLPQATLAHDFLKDRKDPQLGYMWWPAEAYVSCDGTRAVTTGPSVRGAYRGYFTTVWAKQPDRGWKWLLDHGDALRQPRAARESPRLERASCEGRPPQPGNEERGYEEGVSADRTLRWRWNVYENGARIVWAELWDGKAYRLVLEDKVDQPAS